MPDLAFATTSVPGPGGPIPIAIYRPTADHPLPVLVHFQGGGFVHSFEPVNDAFCQRLCAATHCIVATVAYRLAPQHRFPAAPEDCYAATAWVAAHAAEIGGDANRLIVGGESAGGALAAAATLIARDRGGPRIAQQILLYPMVGGGGASASREAHPEDMQPIAAGWINYLSCAADGTNPLAAPLLATDLAGLPPALVVTGENDPLRDEGELYAARLRDAGVPVAIHRVAGARHGFLTSTKTPAQRDAALGLIAEAVRAAIPTASQTADLSINPKP